MSAPRLSPSGSAQPGGIAGYDTQAEAERTIRYLVGQGIPAEQLSLVGTGLRMVAPPLDTSPWRRVLTIGVGAGLVCGLGLGVVLWWFLPGVPAYEVVAWCLCSGLLYGAVASLVVHGLTHAESARSGELVPVPGRFDVVGDAAIAARARTLLADAEEADEGWEVIEAETSEVTVDPRVWSRSAGVATPASTSTSSPTTPTAAKPEPSAPEPVRPSPRAPEPVRPTLRPGVPVTRPPEHAQPAQTSPVPALPPSWRPARALPGDEGTPVEPAASERPSTARRYSFDL